MATNEQVKRVIPTGGTDTNALYIEVKVFLEGVEVPHTSCAVSYGIDSPPTCTITIPANSFLRSLPETTKVLVIFKDLLPDPVSNEYEWRVLFDGELSGFSYAISPNGADMSLSAIHTSAYLTLMQLVNQAATEYIYNRAPDILGEFISLTTAGQSKASITFVTKLLEEYVTKDDSPVKTMGDLTYLMLRNLLEAYKDKGGPVAAWYWDKLGPGIHGYKILDRMYGITNAIKQLPIMDPEFGAGDNISPSYARQVDGVKRTITSDERKDLEEYSKSLSTSDAELCKQVATALIETGVEGDYDGINWNDQDGNFSIGISQWHNDGKSFRARHLLELIAASNNDAKAFVTATNRADVERMGGEKKFKEILSSKEGQAAQRKLLMEDVVTYVHRAREIGITDPRAIVYAATWMPCGARPDAGGWNVGSFIVEYSNRYDINDPNQLYLMFSREFHGGNVQGAAMDYGSRPMAALNYVQVNVKTQKKEEVKPEPTVPVTYLNSKLSEKYTPQVEQTQR